MADLKPAYLVCGDDDAKIDAWRARVRRRAEKERGPGGLEAFDARQSDPAEVAGSLAMLSFDTATRYLLVDDVAAWKAAQLGPLEEAMKDLPPETVLVLIARGKASKQLSKAVESAGGEIREYAAPKPWELPKWCIGHARELGLQLDGEAAKELVARVGTSQQRLSRELEKIGIALHPSPNVSAADVERLAATRHRARRLRPRRRARRGRSPRDDRARRAARGPRRAAEQADLAGGPPAARGAPGGVAARRPACPTRRSARR